VTVSQVGDKRKIMERRRKVQSGEIDTRFVKRNGNNITAVLILVHIHAQKCKLKNLCVPFLKSN
jgi:hypothetical protein